MGEPPEGLRDADEQGRAEEHAPEACRAPPTKTMTSRLMVRNGEKSAGHTTVV